MSIDLDSLGMGDSGRRDRSRLHRCRLQHGRLSVGRHGTRRALRGRGSDPADQRPSSRHDGHRYCSGRAASGRRHRRSRTSFAHRSRHRLAARAVHPLHCRQPAARGGAALFGDAGAGKVTGRGRSVAVMSRMWPPCSSGLLPGKRRRPHPANSDGLVAAGERGGGKSAPRARGMEWLRALAAMVSRRE